MSKQFYFIAGLPRSGSTMMVNILKQNPNIFGYSVSSLYEVFSQNNSTWDMLENNLVFENDKAKMNVLKGIMEGYYSDQDKGIIFDKNPMWVSKISILEEVLGHKVKILCMVRNPAQILTSFERLKRNNPKMVTATDLKLGENTSIAGRAYQYSSPEGKLGLPFQHLRDAITMGYLDRFLFVDYNKFCNTPKSQMKRIYEFFELPEFTHDFTNIEQDEVFNDNFSKLPGQYKIKNKLERTTVNPVEYLGLDLYEQYNREVFWDAWV
jgi:sulfotransferase